MRLLQVTLTWMMVAGCVAAEVRGDSFSKLYVFGDSLSDTGNAYLASGGGGEFGPDGSYPTPPYFNGRITNGPVYVEYLADGLGLSATPSLLGGGNHAFGGAMTGSGFSPQGVPNIGTQIDGFLLGGPAIDGSELFVVWGGANDIALGGIFDPLIPVGNLANHITALAAAGAGNFLVPNLPLLGETPFARSLGPDVQVGLNALTAGFNLALAATLGSLEANLGVTIFRLDVAALFQSALDDPAAYGLTNVTDAAFDRATGTIVPNPGEYLFWDDFHPSATTHRFLGQTAILAVPEPSSLVLSGLGIVAGIAVYSRRRSSATA